MNCTNEVTEKLIFPQKSASSQLQSLFKSNKILDKLLGDIARPNFALAIMLCFSRSHCLWDDVIPTPVLPPHYIACSNFIAKHIKQG